jgi:hypothetical protein
MSALSYHAAHKSRTGVLSVFNDFLGFNENVTALKSRIVALKSRTKMTYVLWRMEMEPLGQIARNAVQDSVKFVFIQLRPHPARRYPIPA